MQRESLWSAHGHTFAANVSLHYILWLSADIEVLRHAVANITPDDYYISLDYQKLTPVVRMLDSELSDTPIDILAT